MVKFKQIVKPPKESHGKMFRFASSHPVEIPFLTSNLGKSVRILWPKRSRTEPSDHPSMSTPSVTFGEVRVINTFLHVEESNEVPMPKVKSSLSEPLPEPLPILSSLPDPPVHFPSKDENLMELLSAELPMMPWNTYDSFEPEKGEGDEGDEGDGNGEPFVAKVSTLEYFEKVSNFGQTVETPFVCKVSTFDFFEDGFHVPGTEYAAKVTPMASVVEPESPCHLRNVCNVCKVPTYCSFDGSFDSHGSCVAPSEPQKLSIFDSFTAMPPMPPMPPMHLPLQLPAGHCLLPPNMSAVKVDFSSSVSSDSTSSTPSAKSCASVPLHVENGESIHWNVDGRKLESQDKQILSPEFELQLPGVPETTPFRLMILAKETRGKGCRGFLKASSGKFKGPIQRVVPLWVTS